MKFTSFTLSMTEDCNFGCSYCYQRRNKKYLDVNTAKNALDFFFPYLTQDCSINFYGGEPLLAIEQIEDIVNYICFRNRTLKKNIEFSITTNGSLIDDEVLRFLNRNKFHVLLSFDGFAQDLSRKKGSFDTVVSIMARLLECTDVELETNSVFTANTVECLAKSMRHIVELGVPNASLSFDILSSWSTPALFRLKKEMSLLCEFSLTHYINSKTVPIIDFRNDSKNSIFGCLAGKDRMALSPEGSLWGCSLFFDCFKAIDEEGHGVKYCFGNLNSFIKNHEQIYLEILSNYSNLRMDHFFTSKRFCVLCEEMNNCIVCPLDTLLGSSITGKIPDWVCRIRRIIRAEKRSFFENIEV